MKLGASRLLLLATTLTVCLTAAVPALAQKSTLPPDLNVSKPQTAFIKNQLTISTDLARKTLAGLETMSSDDSIPIDESMLQNARNTYVLIRAARHGMELNKETSKFPDPTMDLAFKRVNEAWNLARNPVDRSTSGGIPRPQYIQESIQSLNQVIRLLNQALTIMP
jgi:hypothetical protein